MPKVISIYWREREKTKKKKRLRKQNTTQESSQERLNFYEFEGGIFVCCVCVEIFSFAQEITLSSCVLPNIEVQHPNECVWKRKMLSKKCISINFLVSKSSYMFRQVSKVFWKQNQARFPCKKKGSQSFFDWETWLEKLLK